MKTTSQIQIEKLAQGKSFASKVAQTVLKTGKCSWKQFEIMREETEDFIFFEEIEKIDIDNLKNDAKFEAMQDKQRKNQLINL